MLLYVWNLIFSSTYKGTPNIDDQHKINTLFLVETSTFIGVRWRNKAVALNDWHFKIADSHPEYKMAFLSNVLSNDLLIVNNFHPPGNSHPFLHQARHGPQTCAHCGQQDEEEYVYCYCSSSDLDVHLLTSWLPADDHRVRPSQGAFQTYCSL